MKKFYYVYNRAQEKPLHRHKVKKEAIDEAIRLTKELNKNFYVLTPVAHVVSDHKNGVSKVEKHFETSLFKKITSLFERK